MGTSRAAAKELLDIREREFLDHIGKRLHAFSRHLVTTADVISIDLDLQPVEGLGQQVGRLGRDSDRRVFYEEQAERFQDGEVVRESTSIRRRGELALKMELSFSGATDR